MGHWERLSMKGLFITLEGGDGSGKSTQMALLKTFFEEYGYEVVLTREPGGTVISEAIREVILNKDYMEMADMTEALLYAASRAQHVHEWIVPNLKTGKMVICDRYVDSSIVYQGYARGLGIDVVAGINGYATGGLKPDLTILLDLPAEEGIKRKKSQQELDRLELQKLNFHQKVAQGYRMLAEQESERFLTIDAMLDIDGIQAKIRERVNELIQSS